jgi:hypothetical protein
MAFLDMVREIHGSVPKIPLDYCRTLVNRAWEDLRRQNLWSFLLWEGNWLSPQIVNSGAANVSQGSNSVTLNAAADAAFAASITLSNPASQRQFRSSIGTIYNVWAYTSPTLTLDRPYIEASVAAASYSIFQCYYPTPMSDFWSWVSVRDMTNFQDLFTDRYTRGQLDEMDPQRTWYYFPTDVCYYQIDQNPASPTAGNPMFELWGAPQSALPYQLYGLRKGTPLVNPSDTLPFAVREATVLALARKYAYEWAEANKGDSPRNQGPDFRFLIGEAKADYDRLFRADRKDDRSQVDNFFSVRRSGLYGKFLAYYSSVTATGFPGVTL